MTAERTDLRTVDCRRCGTPYPQHNAGEPTPDCRGFLWVDPDGPSPTYRRGLVDPVT